MSTDLQLSAPSTPTSGREVELSWLTVTVRPAGNVGRGDSGQLCALLDAISECASMVVLDLQAVRLRSIRAAAAIENAAWELERHGGCLVCINVDTASRACLAAAGNHAVVQD